MSIIDLSIKRPVFITCLFLLSITVGLISFTKIKVDLYPDVQIPIISIVTTYNGAGPEEIETLISKPIEEAVSSVSGIDSLKSISQDNASMVIISFKIETDLKYAQQQVRDKLSAIKNKLPTDLKEVPVIQVLDPNDKPLIYLAISADTTQTKLYDFVDQRIKPLIEGLGGIGKINIIGGQKREIQVLLDKEKLFNLDISASRVVNSISNIGKNVPGGSFEMNHKNSNVRTLGEFRSVAEVEDVPIKFFNNETITKVGELGKVVDGLEDLKSKAFLNGKTTLVLEIYKSSDANTVDVADSVKKLANNIKINLGKSIKDLDIVVTRDDSRKIRNNIYDVRESILIGLVLTIIAVYLFLGNLRSTLITAIALPNSLIGAFILMYIAGFTINILTLLAMSLAVGLLIDDAIVVRENIFRHMELGKEPQEAARVGSKEILLAVIATTFVVIGVFLPIAFLGGVVGKFFKQFGFTVCFIMIISLLDAITMAPMLSAYFAGSSKGKKSIVGKVDSFVSHFSEKIQDFMTTKYESILRYTVKHCFVVIFTSLALTFGGFYVAKFIPKNFIKQIDNGEFSVSIEMPSGMDIKETSKTAIAVDNLIRGYKEVDLTVLTIGGETTSSSNKANIFVRLVPYKNRKFNTTQMQNQFSETIKKQFKEIENLGIVDNNRAGGSGPSSKNTGAFMLNIVGSNLNEIIAVSQRVIKKLENHPDLQDMDTTYRIGRPEVRISSDATKTNLYGVTPITIGSEVRTFVEGMIANTFKENGYDYNIRVRLQENQRNVVENFHDMFVPNINNKLVKLSNVSSLEFTKSPSNIYRSDRMRYVAVTASVNANGKGGVNQAMIDAETIMKEETKNNPEITYQFDGDAKNFQELAQSIVAAMGLATIFMYLTLASLYESFRQPFMIMTILPLALCGGFYALWITHASLDLFSMIGCVMLIGVAAKNSILLVDAINNYRKAGSNLVDSIMIAGKLRIRPIVMTSIVLIMGMLPVAIGLNEASQQRTSMGIIIVGGLISSTLLSLIFVPALYIAIDSVKKNISSLTINIKNKIKGVKAS